jgi:hypothetical protein
VTRHVWWSRRARSAIEAMSPEERRRFDEIQDFLSGSPYPTTGVDYVRPSRMFGWSGFRYFDDVFPYAIYYDVDEHEMTITLVLRAATKRTPL